MSRARPLVLLLLLFWFGVQLVAATVFRWQDGAGRIHYTDQPPQQDLEHTTIEVISGATTTAMVKRVFDGDTVQLEGWRRVRLIGINTPEVAHRDRPAEAGGSAAKLALQQLVEGKEVRITPDIERKDHYGRILAYLGSEEVEDINQLLLRRGLAHVVFHPPNVSRADAYLEAEAQARQEKLGIWTLPQFQITDIATAGRYRNTFRRLQGVVVAVEERKRLWILRFANEVKVMIQKEDEEQFSRAERAPATFKGRRLTVRGWVQQSRGEPVVRLKDPRQIEEVE
ncbi:MAG: thermonuclease family protein [Gammaproteobacteria bacterium]|nr:thermonuclease family protein [Gammaproteobacteria bacterium]